MNENSMAEKIDSIFRADSDDQKNRSWQRQTAEKRSEAASVWKNKYLNLLADLDNTKKRLERTSALEAEVQKTRLLQDMLEIADGLELALKHISDQKDSRNILQGLKSVGDILDRFFVTYEVEKIDAQGVVFDPNLHEALGMIQHPSAVPHTVVKVEKTGYLYRGKLLRPALVLVAAG